MKKVIYSTISILLCFTFCGVQGHANTVLPCDYDVDELISKEALVKYIGGNDFIVDIDSLYVSYQKVYCSAVHHDDLMTQAHALNQIAFYYYCGQRYAEAVDILLQAYDYSQQVDYKQGQADFHYFMGLIRQAYQNTEQALMHFRHLKALGVEENNIKWEADAYVNMGSVYLSVGNLGDAEEYFRQALQLLDGRPTSETIGWANVHLGTVEVARGDTTEGFAYYSKAIDVWQEHEVSRGLAHIYNEMGRVLALADPLQSLAYHQLALQHAIASSFRSQEIFGYLNIGERYIASDVDSATYYLEKVVNEGVDVTSYWLRKRASTLLMQIYSGRDQAEYDQYLEVSYLVAEKIIDHQEEEFKNWLRLDQEVLHLEARAHEQDLQNELMIQYSKKLWVLIMLLATLVVLAIYFGYRLFLLNRSFENVNKKLTSSVELLEQQSQTLASNNEELNEQKKALSNQLLTRLAIIRDHEVHRNRMTAALNKVQLDEEDRRQLLKIAMDEGNEKLLQGIDEEMQQVNSSLFSELMKRHPHLTANNLRLLSYVKMNLSNKEIADLLYISTASLKVAKSRLIKRMSLPEGVSLTAYLHAME